MKLIAYKDAKSGWRWKIVAKNGKIVCASSEAFTTLANCRKNCVHTFHTFLDHETPDGKIEFSKEADLKKGKK